MCFPASMIQDVFCITPCIVVFHFNTKLPFEGGDNKQTKSSTYDVIKVTNDARNNKTTLEQQQLIYIKFSQLTWSENNKVDKNNKYNGENVYMVAI